MAASGRSARRLLQFFKTTDAPTISAWTEALAAQLDNDVEAKTGKLSERPAAALFGRLFYVAGDSTAANNGILWLDNGTSWSAINPTVIKRGTGTTTGLNSASPFSSCTGSFAHGMGFAPAAVTIIASKAVGASQSSVEATVAPSFAVTAITATEVSYLASVPGISNNVPTFYWTAVS